MIQNLCLDKTIHSNQLFSFKIKDFDNFKTFVAISHTHGLKQGLSMTAEMLKFSKLFQFRHKTWKRDFCASGTL